MEASAHRELLFHKQGPWGAEAGPTTKALGLPGTGTGGVLYAKRGYPGICPRAIISPSLQ